MLKARAREVRSPADRTNTLTSTLRPPIPRQRARRPAVRSLLSLALTTALPLSAAELAGPILVDDGSTHVFQGDRITLSGNDSALTVRGPSSRAHLHDSHLQIDSTLGNGLLLQAGGGAQLQDTAITLAGNGFAMRGEGTGTRLDGTGVDIIAGHHTAQGLVAVIGGAALALHDSSLAASGNLLHASGIGSRLELEDSTVTATAAARLQAHEGAHLSIHRSRLDMGTQAGGVGTGILASRGATVRLTETEFRNGFIDIGSGARLELREVTAHNERGTLRLLGDAASQRHSAASIHHSTLHSSGDIAINVNAWGDLLFSNSALISAPGNGSAAIWLSSDSSKAELDSSSVQVQGDGRHGVEMYGGTLSMSGTSIAVGGNNASALRATGSTGSTRTHLDASTVTLALDGQNSTGVFLAGSNVQAQLRDVEISGNGERSMGVVQVNTATLAPVQGLRIALAGADSIGWRSYMTVAGNHWNRAALRHSRIDTPAGTALRLQGGNHALMVRESAINHAQPGGDLLRVGDTVFTDGSRIAAGQYEFGAAQSVLHGDIWVDSDSAALSLHLSEGTQWRGALRGREGRHAAVLSDQHGTRWQATADSAVGMLQHAGDIALPGASTGRFGRLTVHGDYQGNDGRFEFATRLGDDDAPSDLLHIEGDSSGTARIQVRNAGGSGALTDQGIRLVQVDGNSQAAFRLEGRAVAGAYEYFLFQGSTAQPGDGHWYLRSELPAMPCDQDPQGPGCAPVIPPVDPLDPPVDPLDPIDPPVNPAVEPLVPPTGEGGVLRPEAGAWLANRAAAISLFEHSLHERAGDPVLDAGTRGATEAAGWVRTQQHQQRQQRGAHLHDRGRLDLLQLGADVARWGGEGQGSVGLMFASGSSEHRVQLPLPGYVAQGRMRGRAGGLYATWRSQREGSEHLYVDSWVQSARFRGNVQGAGLERERDGARGWLASLEAGATFVLPSSGDLALFVQPQLQVSWNNVRADDTRQQEDNGTLLNWVDRSQLRSRLGIRMHGHSRSGGETRVQPFVAADWSRRHGAGSTLWMDQVQLGHTLPAQVLRVRAGAQLQLQRNLSAWGELQLERGDEAYRASSALLGVRYRW